MKTNKVVLPSYHFECDSCQIDFSVKQGQHFNPRLDVKCPLCLSSDYLFRHGDSRIVIENPAYVKGRRIRGI